MTFDMSNMTVSCNLRCTNLACMLELFCYPKREIGGAIKMKKLVLLVVVFLLVLVGVVGIFAVVNNNKVSTVAGSAPQVTEVLAPKATATAVPTATTAPQVTEVPAPKATATAVPTVMPMPMVTAMPNIATAVPTNVPTNVSSYEISNETIVTASDGSIRQMMICEFDLNKVEYREIIVSRWNGVLVNCNTKGIVGEVYGRSAFNELKAGVRAEVTVKSFFNANGEVFANNVREGYAIAGTQIGVYNLTNVRFVQLTGESCYRLVVVGKGGNDYPVVTPAPTTNFPDDPIKPEPSHNPETTTPAATATPAPTATPNYATGDLPDFPEDEITTCPSHNPFEVEEVATPTPTPHYAEGDLPDFPD